MSQDPIDQKQRLELPSLKLDWTEGRTERLLANVHTRMARRKRAFRAASAVTALASIVLIAVFALRGSQAQMSASPSSNAPSSSDAPAQIVSQNTIRLGDGSEIKSDAATSEVRIVEETASRIGVEVVRGSSRYSVVPNPDRTFEVRSGSVTITVIGTEFIVERRAETTWVEVLRGKVRVAWGDDQALLVTGETGTFPRESPPSAASASANANPNHDDVDAPNPRGPHASQMYRARVARRDYRGAYAVLAKNPALAGDTVEDLLVAADVARLSDHPAEAVPYLQRVIRDHARDERAPLAAFTLGRTLSGLGRTEEAMNMFGRVQSAWPKSPLGEDALLRQAEAASQLGDLAAARRIADVYDRAYPNGRRRADVRRYARLE